MGQHRRVRLRVCVRCGAQETTDAAGLAWHAAECKSDGIRKVRRRRGRCVDCGKPSLPYVKCPHHRFHDRLKRVLDRGAEYGFFLKTYNEGDRRPLYALGDEHAKVGQRGFYNTRPEGGAPRGFFPFVLAYLGQKGKAMEEDTIIRAFTRYRRDRAARGHLEASG